MHRSQTILIKWHYTACRSLRHALFTYVDTPVVAPAGTDEVAYTAAAVPVAPTSPMAAAPAAIFVAVLIVSLVVFTGVLATKRTITHEKSTFQE